MGANMCQNLLNFLVVKKWENKNKYTLDPFINMIHTDDSRVAFLRMWVKEK